jgi:transposase
MGPMVSITQPRASVGIDISKNWVDVAERVSGRVWRVLQSQIDLEGLVDELMALQPERVVLEASGGYERVLVAMMRARGLPVCVVNPAQARQYARAEGKRAKSDPIDAAMLARMGPALDLEVRDDPVGDQYLVTALTVRREQLIDIRKAEEARLEPGPVPGVIVDQIGVLVAALDRMIADLEAQIDDLITTNREWSAVSKACLSVYGVGPQTVRSLIAFMPELGRINRQQVAALAGLAPYNHESGKKKGKRLISGGRPKLRRALYLAALTAKRPKGLFKTFNDKLTNAGAPFKKVTIAVARKLVVHLNSLAKAAIASIQSAQMT